MGATRVPKKNALAASRTAGTTHAMRALATVNTAATIARTLAAQVAAAQPPTAAINLAKSKVRPTHATPVATPAIPAVHARDIPHC